MNKMNWTQRFEGSKRREQIFRRLGLAAVMALGALSTESTSNAAVIFIAPFEFGTGLIGFSEDIVFNINLGGAAQYLIFDEWVSASDGTPNTALSGTPLAYSVNGGVTASGSMNVTLTDNQMVFGDVTARDGVLRFEQTIGQIALAGGNTFTVKAGSYQFSPVATFGAKVSGPLAGNLFIADQNGVRISNIVQAPEPNSVLLMLGAGITFLGGNRRRKKTAGDPYSMDIPRIS